MSGPRCRWLYENRVRGARAQALLVLTEDDWNDVMGDSVIVPVFRLAGARANPLRVRVGQDLYADCTRAQSILQRHLGRPLRPCDAEPWVRVRVGVRQFLDLDRRIAAGPKPPPREARAEWWPRQDTIHFAEVGPKRKLFAAVSDDDWNSTPGVRHCAAVRLTSRGPKPARQRWEVEVSGGWVVAGDLYALPYAVIDPKPPPSRYPRELTADESARIARRQKTALGLE